MGDHFFKRNGTAQRSTVDAVQIWLTYPREWQCAIPTGTEHDVNRQVEAWLGDLGIFSSREENAAYVQWANPARWIRHAFPFTSPERNLVMSKIFAMATTHDDRLEGVGVADEVVENYRRVITGETPVHPRADDPYLSGWWQIGQELQRSLISHRWLQRFASHLSVWYRGFNDEIALMRRHGRHPPEIEYMAMRHRNSGMVWWIDLIEYSLGKTLPTSVTGTSTHFRELCRLDREVELLHNDLYSAEKDGRDGLPNLVVISSRQGGCVQAEAARAIGLRHAAALRKITELESSLRVELPEIAWWLDAFRPYVPGADFPHAEVGRFGQIQCLEDGGKIRVVPRWG